MNGPIQTLMDEHRVIEQVLGSMETFAINLQNGAEGDRGTVRDYADFLRNFADKYHHAKEEDRLFVKMNEYGFPSEFGPVAVMLAEHVEGRAHVKALADLGAGEGPLTFEERDALVSHGLAYVALLRAHIMKEDNILYPMAMQALPPAEMETLAEAFEVYEKEAIVEGEHARFHALADSLVAAYPGDPERMSAGNACTGCPGHM